MVKLRRIPEIEDSKDKAHFRLRLQFTTELQLPNNIFDSNEWITFFQIEKNAFIRSQIIWNLESDLRKGWKVKIRVVEYILWNTKLIIAGLVFEASYHSPALPLA
jgi:hypothetical protein